jgi:hypothetical protein
MHSSDNESVKFHLTGSDFICENRCSASKLGGQTFSEISKKVAGWRGVAPKKKNNEVREPIAIVQSSIGNRHIVDIENG